MNEEKDLSKFYTCELVDELMKREGVEPKFADPYETITVSIEGPATILVVID